MKRVLMAALLFFLLTLPVAAASEYTDYDGRSKEAMIDGSICVKSPEKNSAWQQGAQVKITWTFIGYTGNYVKIVLHRDYKPVLTIASHVFIEKGEFDWTVPGNIEVGEDYTIKVTSDMLPMCYGFSDKFKLRAAQ